MRIAQAEVGNLDILIFVQQQVLRFQVAVHHILLVDLYDRRTTSHANFEASRNKTLAVKPPVANKKKSAEQRVAVHGLGSLVNSQNL